VGERGDLVSALRKAGVWLGLIEDEDDQGYDDRDYREAGYRDAAYRDGREARESRDPRESRESRFADEFADDEEFDDAPAVPRARSTERDRLSERVEALRAERASVRSITRPTADSASSGASAFGTRDNLALAPQMQLRERAVVATEEEERRYQITTLHPTTYREARTIGEHFRDGVPVIINLTEMEEQDARRLVDFAAGLAFGLRGTIERVTNRVFLLSPANVQVTAEDKAKIAEGGFFNQT
jgi:cell division inhibitor SepF